MSDVKEMSLDDLEDYASKFDWKAFDQTTEAEIERHMIEDGEDPSVPFDSVYRKVCQGRPVEQSAVPVKPPS